MKRSDIRKNDLVILKTGKGKGQVGKVLKVLPDKNRLIVEKVHMVKEFIRPDRSKNIQGGIVEKEAPFDMSNVMLYCGECRQGVRVRHKFLPDRTKIRICAKCETALEKSK